MKNKMKAVVCLLAAMLLLASVACAACPTDDAHRYGSWRIKRNPTCRETGLQFKYCTLCDHWEKREIAKLPHEVEEWTITLEPTCAKEGRKEGVCLTCGMVSRRSIEKLPHTFGEMTVIVEPTCTASGKGSYTCSVCGGVEQVRLDKLGHDWGEMLVEKEATCKRTGSGKATCMRCGRTQTLRIDRLEHVYGEWTIIAEPSGAKKGTEEAVCTLCGEKKTRRFYWEGTLYEGMEPNEDVIRLQEMLRDLGYYKGSIRSGTFGSMTGAAVARFQRDHGLSQTQIADPKTRELIESEWAKLSGGK